MEEAQNSKIIIIIVKITVLVASIYGVLLRC